MATTNGPHRAYKNASAPKVSQSNAAAEKVGGPLHRTEPTQVEEIRSNASLQYVAMKPMKVNGVQVNPGDLVPAANTWRNLHNYISTGFLAVIGR